jgi:hypothetical protein
VLGVAAGEGRRELAHERVRSPEAAERVDVGLDLAGHVTEPGRRAEHDRVGPLKVVVGHLRHVGPLLLFYGNETTKQDNSGVSARTRDTQHNTPHTTTTRTRHRTHMVGYLGLEGVHLGENFVGEGLGEAGEAHGDALDGASTFGHGLRQLVDVTIGRVENCGVLRVVCGQVECVECMCRVCVRGVPTRTLTEDMWFRFCVLVVVVLAAR